VNLIRWLAKTESNRSHRILSPDGLFHKAQNGWGERRITDDKGTLNLIARLSLHFSHFSQKSLSTIPGDLSGS
jgi:hypothetical protein